jgi:hypothetical protein
MKQSHYRGSRLQERYEHDGMICPADLCDIFECPEFSDTRLKTSVYIERTSGIYEGRHIKGKRQPREAPKSDKSFKYDMVQHYDANRKATLLQRCHRTFLDCVDYDHLETQKENVLKAFDFFSQMYCQKFEVGVLDTLGSELEDI